MSLGTSIFFSSVLLAFVALYIATKDRWRWKRIVLWPLGGAVLIGIGSWGYLAIDFAIEQRPKVVTSFWDIPLGATEGDVKFLKGAPNVLPIEKAQDTWEYMIEDRMLKQWHSLYRIGFKDGKVWLITYFASPLRTYGPGIHGIDIGDPLVEISQKFGSPSLVSVSADQLSRVYSFAKYQVAFELKENRVVGYGIFDATVAPEGMRHHSDKPTDTKPKR